LEIIHNKFVGLQSNFTNFQLRTEHKSKVKFVAIVLQTDKTDANWVITHTAYDEFNRPVAVSRTTARRCRYNTAGLKPKITDEYMSW